MGDFLSLWLMLKFMDPDNTRTIAKERKPRSGCFWVVAALVVFTAIGWGLYLFR